VAHAWLPGARRIQADSDGGPLRGGVPRAVWLTLSASPGSVSIQSAAQRLISERRACHLVWDPVSGEIAQLISVLRAGRALGAPERLSWSPNWSPRVQGNVNAEGRVCVQIGVLGHPSQPFTAGPLTSAGMIVSWLDSWGVPRRWPCGQPPADSAPDVAGQAARCRVLWARGGHFGASQVPGCESAGPGAIDIDRLTGAHVRQVKQRKLPVVLSAAQMPIPA
jgi:hypothetical protein